MLSLSAELDSQRWDKRVIPVFFDGRQSAAASHRLTCYCQQTSLGERCGQTRSSPR